MAGRVLPAAGPSTRIGLICRPSSLPEIPEVGKHASRRFLPVSPFSPVHPTLWTAQLSLNPPPRVAVSVNVERIPCLSSTPRNCICPTHKGLELSDRISVRFARMFLDRRTLGSRPAKRRSALETIPRPVWDRLPPGRLSGFWDRLSPDDHRRRRNPTTPPRTSSSAAAGSGIALTRTSQAPPGYAHGALAPESHCHAWFSSPSSPFVDQ